MLTWIQRIMRKGRHRHRTVSDLEWQNAIKAIARRRMEPMTWQSLGTTVLARGSA